MGRRIGAYIIDAILIAILAVGLAVAGFFAFKPYDKVTGLSRYSGGASEWCSANYSGNDNDDVCVDTNDDTAYLVHTGGMTGILVGAEAIGWLLDFVILQGITGASVGKLLVGLRVVKHDGEICGVGRALVRSVLLIVDGICFAIVGLLTSFLTKGHRRVGDMAASTLVVRKEQVGRPVMVPGLTTPELGGGYPTPSYGQPYQPPAYTPPAYTPPADTPPADPQQAGWAGPASGEEARAPSSAAHADTPSGDGPHWDDARQAYITYDRSRGAWLEYDQAAGTWGPISQ
jgi:uncharacterized RDD family membrane protein YckC